MFNDVGTKIEKDMIREGKIMEVIMIITLVVFIFSLGYIFA